ncbi:hypothetical protein [Acinetobacter ursingii]|uniref:hypothetical protein n=1 Tax=Acinetobacter ursingii TaxID=108980 RepID=UPI00300AFA44
MKFTTDAVITGAKSYNNVVDGVQHNFTKIFVMTDLSNASGVGSATVEYKWGTSDNIKKIQDAAFPIQAKVDMEIVTNGNKQVTVVHDVKIVQAQKS